MTEGIAFSMQLSLLVASIATALVALVGLPLAYVLATRSFRGKAVVDVLVTLPMVLPPIVTGYYLLLLIGRNGLLGSVTRALTGTAIGLTFTWQAAVLAAFAVSLPLTVKTARAAFEGVDPSLVHTAHTLGRGELQTALLVVLPLAARGVAAGLMLSFARALGEFGATVVVAGNIPGRTDTMPLQIYNAVVYGDWRSATLLVGLFTAVTAGFMFLASRAGKAVTS